MPTPIIDAIFEVYSQTREYAELTQTKAIVRAEADVLRKMPDPFEDEPLVTALIALVERRIFVLGFQHALRLMFEAQTSERSPARPIKQAYSKARGEKPDDGICYST